MTDLPSITHVLTLKGKCKSQKSLFFKKIVFGLTTSFSLMSVNLHFRYLQRQTNCEMLYFLEGKEEAAFFVNFSLIPQYEQTLTIVTRTSRGKV